MKLFLSVAAILLRTGSVTCSSIPRSPVQAVADDGCGISVLLPSPPPADFSFPSFCSAYEQPTVTKTAVISTTVVRTTTKTGQVSTITNTSTKTNTALRTSLVTVTTTVGTTVVVTTRRTSTSKTTTSSPTTTSSVPSGSLCPHPQVTDACNVQGYGYSDYSIYSGQDVDANSCHQLCLSNANCRSFQVSDATVSPPQCYLYNVAISNSTILAESSPFTFFDANCPQYSPAGCQFSGRDAPALEERDALIDIPGFLNGVDPDIIAAICICIVPIAPPATIVTVTRTTTQTSYVTTILGATTTTAFVTTTQQVTNVVTNTAVVSQTKTTTRTSTIAG